MRVLIIKPSSLGDVIHALPAVELLRRSLGNRLGVLGWVVNDSLSGILEMMPGIDKVIPFPRASLMKDGHWKAFLAELRSEKWDVCIDFQGLLRSGLMAFFSGATRRIGFATGRECSPWFYSDAYTPAEGCRHAVDKNIDLVHQAFPESREMKVVPPELVVGKNWLVEAAALLKKGTGPVLAVGCSSRWPSKNWPKAFFASVLDRVAERLPEATIWLLGAPSDSVLCQEVCGLCKTARPMDLSGRTKLMGLVGLLASSQALLTNDSGPMHIAAALGVPVVALFGSTDPTLTGPYGDDDNVVFRSGCEKSPCFLKQCPLKQVECSAWTSPDDVALAVCNQLTKKHE